MNKELNRDLFYASGMGKLEEVKQLLSKGAEVNWKNPDASNWVSFNFVFFLVCFTVLNCDGFEVSIWGGPFKGSICGSLKWVWTLILIVLSKAQYVGSLKRLYGILILNPQYVVVWTDEGILPSSSF